MEDTLVAATDGQAGADRFARMTRDMSSGRLNESASRHAPFHMSCHSKQAAGLAEWTCLRLAHV